LSDPHFHLCDALLERGVEHGLGKRDSEQARVHALVLARQVHGTRLLRVPSGDPDACADAVYTCQPGVAVGVRTADCVPILLVDAELRGVAAVHAGWRGSAAGIAASAAHGFAEALGTATGSLLAVVGPHIGPCCYEVDDPVRDTVADKSAFSAGVRAGHYMLDLFALTRAQLVSAGVDPERVQRVGACTACHPELYASYRRDRNSGRMVHYVRMPVS
jgi:YfiH family protein